MTCILTCDWNKNLVGDKEKLKLAQRRTLNIPEGFDEASKLMLKTSQIEFDIDQRQTYKRGFNC